MNVPLPAQRGRTLVSEKALKYLVECAVREVPGTIDSSRVLGRNYPVVSVDSASDDEGNVKITADVRVGVAWPAPATAVAEAVRESARIWLKDMTGLTNTHVNVEVEAVEAGHGRTSASALTVYNPHPQLSVIRVIEQAAKLPKVIRPTKVTAVTAPEPEAVKTDLAPTEQPVRSVSAPTPQAARSVSAPAPVVLEKVVAPTPERVLHVKAPKPEKIRPIQPTQRPAIVAVRANEQKVWSPEVPKAEKLTPVRLHRGARRFAKKVTVPRAHRLAPISINEQQVVSPQITTLPVASVSAPAGAPLVEVTVPKAPRLRKTRAPRALPLRDITIFEQEVFEPAVTPLAPTIQAKAPRPIKVVSPSAPKPFEPVAVSAPRVNVFSPKAPRATLTRTVRSPRPVRVHMAQPPRKPQLVSVEAPTPRIVEVSIPEPAPLKTIEVIPGEH